jgi:hypothetical protein
LKHVCIKLLVFEKPVLPLHAVFLDKILVEVARVLGVAVVYVEKKAGTTLEDVSWSFMALGAV